MDQIEVYPIGTIVQLDGTLEARITAIFIREGCVSYECVWWNNRERNAEVIEPWEIVKVEARDKVRLCQVL